MNAIRLITSPTTLIVVVPNLEVLRNLDQVHAQTLFLHLAHIAALGLVV